MGKEVVGATMVMDMLNEFEEKCEASISQLSQVAEAIRAEMEVGLATEGGCKLKMFITYVDNLPTRTQGTYYYG
ncbi:hypothetical protein LIER_13557 [Lithospermum erythrorhizon]|uniref:Phosphotransferase n=1 Tax=Lithospermum erythrorhizon TaxID=34254 RepID=A0AAV3PXW6_LITER